MKKNYFKTFYKSFGVLPVIVFAAVLIAVSILSESVTVTIANKGLQNLVVKCLEGISLFGIPGLALVGIAKLKDDKMNLIDLVRFGTLVGAVCVFIVRGTGDVLTTAEIVMYIVSLVLLISEIVVRVLFTAPEPTVVGIKAYFGKLSQKYNFVILTIVGAILAVIAIVAFKSTSPLYASFLKYYWAIVAIIAVFFAFLIPLVFRSDVTLFDAALVLFSAGVVTIFIYALGKPVHYGKFMLLSVEAYGCLFLRGMTFGGEVDDKKSRLKVNRYYGAIFTRWDNILPILAAIVLAAAVTMPLYFPAKTNRILSVIFPGFSGNSANSATAFSIIAIVVCIALGALVFVFKKIKSEKLEKVDYVIVFMLLIAVFFAPYCLKVLKRFSWYMSFLGSHVVALLAFIALLLMSTASLVLTGFRLRFYKGEEEEVAEEPAEETAEEEPAEEQPVEEEKTEEETTEETTEEVTEEVAEEQPAEEEVTEETVEETAEETVEEQPAEEEVVEETAAAEEVEETAEEPAEEGGEENPTLNLNKITRRKFSTRIKYADDEAKAYYSEIKNHLMMYRAKARSSARCESFKYKGIIAKMGMVGKTLRVWLAIEPASLEGTKYHFKDVSDKKLYAEVPTMLKIRSARGVKYCKELIDMLMASREVKPKRNFEPVDYIPTLIPDGEAVLDNLGINTAAVMAPQVSADNIPANLPDDLENALPTVEGDPLEGEEEVVTVYTDTLCKHFEEGEPVDIIGLKSAHAVTNGNAIIIKARGTVDKKLTVYAEYFESDALKMLLCANCTVIKIVR